MSAGAVALLLSSMAGLGTVLGGLLVIGTVSSRTDRSRVGQLQALSAGVMLSMAILNLIPEALGSIPASQVSLSFLLGVLAMYALDVFLPETESMSRSGWAVYIAMALHNIPEGLAVYFGVLKERKLGLALALAMTCHNVPEGMAVAIPLYVKNRKAGQALKWTLLNGLVEPLAVLLCWILSPELSDSTVSVMLAAVAGVMTCVSLIELIPSAVETCDRQWTRWLIGGMTLAAIIGMAAE